MTSGAAKQWTSAALLLAVLAAMPMWRCFVFGELFVPGAMVRGFEPWGAKTGEAWDILRWDAVAQFYPWRQYLFGSLTSGHVPLWNRHELLGTPFLANSQCAVFYPLHWVLAPLGAGWGITVAAFLHLVWAGLGCYVVCRRFGCGWGPAVLAGLTFELSQWVISWLQLPSVPTTVSWTPWLLAAVHRVWLLPDAKGVARLAGCAAMLLLAGHLQIASYGLGAAAVLALFLLSSKSCDRRRLRLAGAWAGGVALGVALAAAQLLPVLEMGRLSHRASSPSDEGYRAYVRLAMPPALLGLAVDPYMAGDPRLGTVRPGPVPAGEYWGAEPLPEYAAYIGLAAVVCAGYGVLRICSLGSGGWALLTIGVGAWLLALGTDLNRMLYFGVPGWAATGSPARALCLAALAGAVLAGMGLEQMLEDGRELAGSRRRVIGSALVVASGLLGGGMLWWVSSTRPSVLPPGEAASAAWAVLLPLLAAVLLLLAWTGIPWAGRIRLAIPIVLQVAFLAPFALHYNPTYADDVYPAFPGLARLRQASPNRVAVVNGDRWNRYLQPPAVLPPNAALALGFDEVGGYDSLILKSSKERLLDAVNGGDSAVLANGNMLFVKPQALKHPEALAAMGVRYVIVCSHDAGRSTENGPLLMELEPAAMAEVSGAAAALEWTDPNGFQLRTDGRGGPTLVRVAAAPGWTARDGTHEVSVGRTGSCWLAADLPVRWAVSHWRYAPSSYRVGLFLTLAGLGVTVGLSVAKCRLVIKNKPQS